RQFLVEASKEGCPSRRPRTRSFRNGGGTPSSLGFTVSIARQFGSVCDVVGATPVTRQGCRPYVSIRILPCRASGRDIGARWRFSTHLGQATQARGLAGTGAQTIGNTKPPRD